MGKLIADHREESSPDRLPPLESGDRLTRAEFDRRYAAMRNLKKAELIEGVVYVPSPTKHQQHGGPNFRLNTWLGNYSVSTPGVDGGSQSTLLLDWQNEYQPDAFLRILPNHGGLCRTNEDGYIDGAPELVAEVAATSASYDLHAKMRVYRRSGVREYLVWRVLDHRIEWFVLQEGEFVALPPDPAGILRSMIFPGLWLDTGALLEGSMKRVLGVLQEGLASGEHDAFAARLEESGRARPDPGA